MSDSQEDISSVLKDAYESARKNDWKLAADLARNAVEAASSDGGVEQAKAFEFSAKCHFKAAFQSETRAGFNELMLTAQNSNSEASVLFEQASQIAIAKRAAARSQFARYWISDEVTLRREIIQSCILLSTEAANSPEFVGNLRELVNTRMDLISYFRESVNLSLEWKTLNYQFHQALATARKCLTELESLGDIEHLIEAQSFMVWLISLEGQVLLTPTEFQSLEPEARTLEKSMAETSEKIQSDVAAFLAYEAAANIAFDFEGDYDKAMTLYEKASRKAESVRDTLLTGRVNWLMAQVAYWRGLSAEDDRERRASLLRGIDAALASIRYFQSSRPTSDLAAAHASCANCHTEYANQVEARTGEKEEHFRMAIQISNVGTSFEEGTWGWVQAAHALSSSKYFLSKIVPQNEKHELLMASMPIRNETVQVADRLFPTFWNPVVMRNYSALVKFDLALDEESKERKILLLKEAVSEMKECLELGSKWATSPGLIRRLGAYSEWFGIILNELFLTTREPTSAKQAVSAFDTSISYLVRCGHFGAVGMVRWRIARIHDASTDFFSAAHHFGKAAEEFRYAAEKMSALSSTYSELALYMDAWNHTESARLLHQAEDFSGAAQEYSKSGEILFTSKNWGYLAGLFKARSLLEKGESLSREENHREATLCFITGEKAFADARKQLETRSQEGNGDTEQREIRDWLTVTEGRNEYCHFRAELEEARALDKEGERLACARKYTIASEGLRALKASSNPQDPEELEVLACFCDAWAKMQEAEAQSSPELYSEASARFLGVKEIPWKEPFRLLGLANSSICRALEAGTKFRQTRELQFYSDVKKWLESAADYYREAGFGKTESWTRATQRLFDALVYLSQAETDRDPAKKASLYHLAETQLEQAAKLYDEAGFPGKKLETLGRLERAREEREVLVTALASLSKIPALTGSSLLPVALARGHPSGLERFDEAYVVGELSTPQSEIVSGTSLSLDLDMANVGKTAATLLKVDGLVQEGLKFEDEKNSYKRENGSVNLAGKRLDRLQTVKASVTLTAVRRGTYQVRPKIFFTDDRGNYKSYQLRPYRLEVQESGGPSEPTLSTLAPSTIQAQLSTDFRFDTQRAREVFERLVNDFVKDYVSKRVSMDNAGWRTLMEIVREVKTPRSAFYGPGGRMGPVLAELERRGLVEVRVFPGERGRGGTVKKLRVAYDNLIVRDIIQKTVMERT